MATDTEAYATAVMRETERYLAEVRECVALLPDAVDRYGQPGFDDVCERVHDRESAADEYLRELIVISVGLFRIDRTTVCGRTGKSLH